MKRNSPFYLLVFVMVFLIFSIPFIVVSQPTFQTFVFSEKSAREDAKRDVERDINKPMWVAVGCLLPVFGLLGPYLYRPPVPTGRIVGKPPEYVAFYTDAYKTEMERLQFQFALAGCVTGAFVQGCLVLFWIGLTQ